MVGTFPQAWEETCIISIVRLGGTIYEYMAITESVDLPQGDYPGESITNVGGGRIWKQSAEEDGEITLEMYSVDIGEADNGGLQQAFAGGTIDSSQPLASDISWAAGVQRTRDRFMVAVMWTDDVAQTAATDATSTADAVAIRFYAKECRITSFKTSFTDGIKKDTVTFKFPAMNKSGTTKTWAWESTNDGDGASALPALTYSAAL